MSISVIFVIKNGILNGYCFWESLQSCLPFADEIVISEGHSEDKTKAYMDEFVNRYGKKVCINLYQDEWEKESYHGEVISRVSERAIAHAKCDLVFLLQADEIIDGKTAKYIIDVSKGRGISAVSFPFYHFLRGWTPVRGGYNEAVRMVKRGTGRLKGDGWTFIDCNPVYPSNHCPKPIFHFAFVFPNNNIVKDIEHYKIYTNVIEYKNQMASACKLVGKRLDPYPLGDFNDFPELARRFIGKAEYPLPFEL